MKCTLCVIYWHEKVNKHLKNSIERVSFGKIKKTVVDVGNANMMHSKRKFIAMQFF